ncbi:MAG: hypothetical protein ACLQJR_27260 [Stellaceae bacterium]
MKPLLCIMMLIATLAVAACAANQAQQPGAVDHNNDLPSWEQ